MSAMHWEARRRQSTLERRAARDKQKLLQEETTTGNTVTEPRLSQEQTAMDQCPYCKSSLKIAKIPNRYSSLQYKQQW